jgi:hypothetical protein
MGYKSQFVTLAGFHALNFSMFELARQYREEGMAAYSRLQQSEFGAEKNGYTATKHQREVGTGYFDEVAKVISSGDSSTIALDGTTFACGQMKTTGAWTPTARSTGTRGNTRAKKKCRSTFRGIEGRRADLQVRMSSDVHVRRLLAAEIPVAGSGDPATCGRGRPLSDDRYLMPSNSTSNTSMPCGLSG